MLNEYHGYHFYAKGFSPIRATKDKALKVIGAFLRHKGVHSALDLRAKVNSGEIKETGRSYVRRNVLKIYINLDRNWTPSNRMFGKRTTVKEEKRKPKREPTVLRRSCRIKTEYTAA